MFNLGVFYMKGLGVKVDLQEGFRWFFQATECPVPAEPSIRPLSLRVNGVSNSMHAIAYCFTHGVVVPKNDSMAFDYLTRAAELDNAAAINDLGDCFLTGKYAQPINPQKGADYFRKAASLGDSTAMFNLATYYANEEKFQEAKQWIAAAKSHGNVSVNELETAVQEYETSFRAKGSNFKLYREITKKEFEGVKLKPSPASDKRGRHPRIEELEVLSKSSVYLEHLYRLTLTFSTLDFDNIQEGFNERFQETVSKYASLLRESDAHLVLELNRCMALDVILSYPNCSQFCSKYDRDTLGFCKSVDDHVSFITDK